MNGLLPVCVLLWRTKKRSCADLYLCFVAIYQVPEIKSQRVSHRSLFEYFWFNFKLYLILLLSGGNSYLDLIFTRVPFWLIRPLRWQREWLLLLWGWQSYALFTTTRAQRGLEHNAIYWNTLPCTFIHWLEVLGPSGPRHLAGGPSGLLTSSFAPFGRSGRVTHGPVIR